MNYYEGIKHMSNLDTKSGSFSPYNGITINYPGYKGKDDYCVTTQEAGTLRHSDVSNELYNFINNNDYSFQELNALLTDVYDNGTNTPYNDATLEYLKHLIYWMTLQEEINYPRSKNCAGINLPFCRYFEAIYCTQPSNNLDIETIQSRCNNHGRTKPYLYTIDNAPHFYRY